MSDLALPCPALPGPWMRREAELSGELGALREEAARTAQAAADAQRELDSERARSEQLSQELSSSQVRLPAGLLAAA